MRKAESSIASATGATTLSEAAGTTGSTRLMEATGATFLLIGGMEPCSVISLGLPR